MSRSPGRALAVRRAVRRWLRRFFHFSWRIASVLLLGACVMGPAPPKPPPREQMIACIEDDGTSGDEAP
jgi:hypothetical protein